MLNPFKIILILHYHYKVLGIQGIILLLKRSFYKRDIIKTRISGYPHPIYLRNNTSDITVFYQVFLEKSYQINYVVEPKIILDCGANIGISTIFFKMKFPQAQIISIEPEKSNYDLLLKNTANLNNVFCENAGIWNKETNLIIENNSSENWGFVVKEIENENELSIKAISISGLMHKYNLPKIDILKVDIEGSEKELFEKNYIDWLSKTKVLSIELHDGYRKGASKSFFKAIAEFEFSMMRKNENLIFYLD